MQNCKVFTPSYEIGYNQSQIEDFARSVWEKSQAKKERLKIWCRTVQLKSMSSSNIDYVDIFIIPKEFDFKGKDLALWNKEIVEWCSKKNLRLQVRSHADDLTDYKFNMLKIEQK
jgi:hypothetical protein